MPEEPSLLQGYPPPEAAWRLLRLKGYAETYQAFQEAYLVDGAPESMLPPLEVEGIHARLALLQPEDLVFLDLPTLLQLKDGSWVLLKGRKGRECQVQGPGGTRWLSGKEVAGQLRGPALDLSPCLPEAKIRWGSLRPLLIPQVGALVHLLVATVLLQLLALALAEATGLVMNRALPDGAWSLLQLLSVGVMLIAAFQAWIGWIRERTLLFLATRLEISAERGFLEHLLRLPFPLLQQRTLGDLLQAFGGLTTARELLTERTLGVLLDGVMAGVYLVAMGFKILVPTLVVGAVAAGMAGIAVLVGRAQARWQALEVAAHAKERSYLTELVSGIGTLKAAGAEHRGLYRWLDFFQDRLGCTLRKSRMGLWSEVGLATLQQAMTALLLIWGGNLALKGELQIGTLFAFLQLASGFLGAVFGVVNAYLILAVLRPQLAKTQEILATQAEPRVPQLGGGPSPGPVAVTMENVWFRYSQEGPWILKDYNLQVEPRGRCTLSGPSGWGKSTVLRLLAGLHVPERGTIRIGGLSPQAARRKILYLPQFVQLYGGSILENLRILSGGAPLEQLMASSQQTGLHDLVATLPMAYQTVLPHGGGSLSGGQRQLIALTGALASGREVLILDEAMANMDNLTIRNVNSLMNGLCMTIVASSHELTIIINHVV